MLDKLNKLREELNVPKNQFNSFGNYHYRSQEDILEAVKPLLIKYGFILLIDDEIKEVCGMPYVKASCIIEDIETGIFKTASASAGIDVNKKGMDVSQSFGSSSSYARKYALNAMFLIDDVKDSDSTNKGVQKSNIKEENTNALTGDKKWLNQKTKDGQVTPQWTNIMEAIYSGKIQTLKDVLMVYKVSKETALLIEDAINNLNPA